MEVDPVLKLCAELLAEGVAGVQGGGITIVNNQRCQQLLHAAGYGDLDDYDRDLVGGLLGLAVHFVFRYATAVGAPGTVVTDNLLMTMAAVEVENGS